MSVKAEMRAKQLLVSHWKIRFSVFVDKEVISQRFLSYICQCQTKLWIGIVHISSDVYESRHCPKSFFSNEQDAFETTHFLKTGFQQTLCNHTCTYKSEHKMDADFRDA